VLSISFLYCARVYSPNLSYGSWFPFVLVIIKRFSHKGSQVAVASVASGYATSVAHFVIRVVTRWATGWNGLAIASQSLTEEDCAQILGKLPALLRRKTMWFDSQTKRVFDSVERKSSSPIFESELKNERKRSTIFTWASLPLPILLLHLLVLFKSFNWKVVIKREPVVWFHCCWWSWFLSFQLYWNRNLAHSFERS